MAEQTRATYEARIWDCKDKINREVGGEPQESRGVEQVHRVGWIRVLVPI